MNCFKNQPYGVMFHHFHDNHIHPIEQGSISADDLQDLLDSLEDSIINAGEWRTKALAGNLKNSDVCLTFDDTLRCQYDIAYPILKKRGITAFWFISTSPLVGEIEPLEVYRYFRSTVYNTIDVFYATFFNEVRMFHTEKDILKALKTSPGFIGYLEEFPFYTYEDRLFRYIRDNVLQGSEYNQIMDKLMYQKNVDVDLISQNLWMDNSCIKQLFDENHIIGLHSHTHPLQLAKMEKATQCNEYFRNIFHIEEIIGERPDTMSHPCNSYNCDTIEVLRMLDIKMGFRSNIYPVPSRNEFEWPREDHVNILSSLRAESMI